LLHERTAAYIQCGITKSERDNVKMMTSEKTKQAQMILVEMKAAKTLLDEGLDTWRKYNRLSGITNVRFLET